MNNKHEHIYDDCIGNPPFAEALKTLGGEDEYKLTEEQQRFFDENKERVSNLPEDATEREKEFAKIALFMANYAENLQMALNRVKASRTAAKERAEVSRAHREEQPHPEGRADARTDGADAEAHEVELT